MVEKGPKAFTLISRKGLEGLDIICRPSYFSAKNCYGEESMYRAPTHKWYLERIIWLIAGIVVVGGICLGLLVHPYWFALPILAGINMIIFSFTGFCPMAVILNKVFHIRPLVDRSRLDEEGSRAGKA